MATKKLPGKKPARTTGAAAVEAFLAALSSERRAELQAVRTAILRARDGIDEGIKWNAPSFRTADDFATFHLRGERGLQIILHTGAKVRTLPKGGLQLDDPAGLVKWLAPDRCLVTLAAGTATAAQLAPLQALVRQWLAQVEDLPLAAKKASLKDVPPLAGKPKRPR